MLAGFCRTTVSPLQNIVRDVVWNDYLGINLATIAWNQLGGLKVTFRLEQLIPVWRRNPKHFDVWIQNWFLLNRLVLFLTPSGFLSGKIPRKIPSKSQPTPGPWHFDQLLSASSRVTTAPGNRRSHSVIALWRPTNCRFPSPWNNGIQWWGGWD